MALAGLLLSIAMPTDVEKKHSIIQTSGLGTRLTHLSRPVGHCFVNPPVQRGSTVLFPTVEERNASWSGRKRFEQELTYGINGSQVRRKSKKVYNSELISERVADLFYLLSIFAPILDASYA